MPWRFKQTFHTVPMAKAMLPELNKTQALVEGFDLNIYQHTRVAMIGAGGLGSHIASGLVRQGIKELTIIDHDVVEPANLTRQLFDRSDIGKFKAVRLAKHLADQGLFPTKLVAQPFGLVELVEAGQLGAPDLIIVGVDNSPARRAATLYGLAHAIRVVHVAVGADANAISVMVQEPGGSCWACAYPHAVGDYSFPCGLPGIVDVLQVAAGVVLFAVASLLSGRHREWNERTIYLDGGMNDRTRMVEKRSECALCGHAATAARAAEPGAKVA